MSDEKITKDTTIADAMRINPKAADVLASMGMRCFGCAMARGETIEEAAMAHGNDVNEILSRIEKG